jgi:Ca-activated chloride channel family protein
MSLGLWLSWFANPAVLAALAVLPALGLLALVGRVKRRRALARIGPPFALAQLVEHPRRRWTPILIGLAVTLIVVGAAGPRWGMGAPPPVAPGRDIVVVLDLSRSMLARDTLPSRLGKAKEALAELADAVQTRGGHRLALVAFAARAQLVCPLTHDYEAFRTKLAALDADSPPANVRAADSVSGTRLGAGLRAAVAALDPRDRSAQDVLLITDGDDPADDDEWRTGLADARAAGVPIHVVGVGDPNRESPIPTVQGGRLQFQGTEVRTRLHEEPLREIARRSGGTYLPAHTAAPPLADFFRTTIATGPTREAVQGTLPQPPGRQGLFFAAALALLTLRMPGVAPREWLRRGAARLRTLRGKPLLAVGAFLMIGASPAVDEALRLGNTALKAGRPDEALTQFARAAERTTDPGQVAFNQGVALARLSRHRDAELHFRRCLSDAEGERRVRAVYNLGCCLLQESRGRLIRPLRQAVQCFEQAVDGADANVRPDILHNLELAKRLLLAARASSPHQTEPPDDEPDFPASRPIAPDPMSPSAPGRDPGTALAPADRSPQANAKSGDPGPAKATDHPPPPGKGNLPPLPDDDALVQMTPEDARAHLERAAARIVAERLARLRQTAPSPSQRYPEW